MREKLNLTVVDALRFHANSCRACRKIAGRNRVIHDIDHTANCALCVQQGCRAFDDFDLLCIEQIHVHAVISAQTRDVSRPHTIIQYRDSIAGKASYGWPANSAAEVGDGNA